MEQPAVDYVGRRTELLAMTFLTRHSNITALEIGIPGVDMLAYINPRSQDNVFPSGKLFGIVLAGTTQPLNTEDQASKFANHKWKPVEGKPLPLIMPILNLIFSMEDDKGYWVWSVHPTVVDDPKR